MSTSADRRARRSCGSSPPSAASGTASSSALFAGCFGIFGHGNVAGVGQALLEAELLEPGRAALLPGPQRAGHGARRRGYARMRNRLSDLGLHGLDRAGLDQHGHRRGAGHGQPAAGAAAARRRLRDPGVRARCCRSWRTPAGQDVTVNDAFRPVSRFFDRVWRPEQLPAALLGAMRVLTDPAETGAATIALPQDVQARGVRLAGGAVRRAGLARRPAGAGAGGAGPRGRGDPVGPAARCSSPAAG